MYHKDHFFSHHKLYTLKYNGIKFALNCLIYFEDFFKKLSFTFTICSALHSIMKIQISIWYKFPSF